MIERMAEAVLFMEIVMYTKVNGKMTKLMEKEYIPKMMGQVIQENGFRTFSMDLGFKNGLMDLLMKGIIRLN